MVITVENLNFCESKNDGKCIHSLPCKVHFNGEANVDGFFTPSCAPASVAEDELTVSFRGYPLNGAKVTLPEHYYGFILEEKTGNSTKDICNVDKFKSLTYWNWDKKPSKNDLFLSVLDWIDLSQISTIECDGEKMVHDPIEDETVD